jgi:type I restriction enzyme, S subunit
VTRNNSQAKWEQVTVADLGEIVSGGTPSRANSSFWHGDIAWVTPSEITSLADMWLDDTAEKITPSGLATSAARLLPIRSVVVTTRASLGGVAITRVPIATNQGFKNIIPNAATDAVFCYYAIQAIRPDMKRLANGTTFLEISKRDFARIRLLRPPRIEQQRIGEILLTLDTTIGETNQGIAKLQLMRAGLLHDLLTRGLAREGHLRDPFAHPEQFQDTAFGLVPRHWDIRTLEDACDWSSGGTPDRRYSQWWEGTLPFLTPKDMKSFLLTDTIEHVTEEAGHVGSKIMPEETAYIIVRGMILAHTFPVVFSNRRFAFNQDIKAARGRTGLNTRFFAHWLRGNANLFLRKTTEATHGTKKLDLSEIYRVEIAVPPEPEQTEIIRRIDEIDQVIQVEEGQAEKMAMLKSGLMTDLLTGRVRVPETITSKAA